MRTYTDEELMAYADGELPASQAQAISAAAQNDPALARRIAPFVESRRILQEAFSKQLREPVPQRLLDVLREQPDKNAESSKVVPLPRRERPSWAGWMPMALAASLALAVGLSTGDWLGQRRAPQNAAVAGLPSNSAAITVALETLPSGQPMNGEARGVRYEVLPLASLRTVSGAYCREFESTVFDAAASQRARGLACRRTDGRWETQAVASVFREAVPSPGDGAYVPASGGLPDLTAALGAVQRLTPAEEQAQIQNRWNK